jgi:hypothetical protein
LSAKVTRIEYKTNAQIHLVGKTEEQTILEDQGIREKIMVKCIFRKRMEQGAKDHLAKDPDQWR